MENPKDDTNKALQKVAGAHGALWSTGWLLNQAAMMGVLPGLAKFWLLHIVSNFEWVVNGYGIYALIDGNIGAQYIALYVFGQFIFWAIVYFFGMSAVTFLDRDYPYLDSTLTPSIFYLLGLAKHVEQYPFEDIEWPEEEEKKLVEEDTDGEEDEEVEDLESGDADIDDEDISG